MSDTHSLEISKKLQQFCDYVLIIGYLCTLLKILINAASNSQNDVFKLAF